MADLSALDPIKRNLLERHGDAKHALPHLRRLLLKRVDLLDLLALAYLEADADPVPGQRSLDAPLDRAGTAAAGQVAIDAHDQRAGGGPTSKPALRVKPIKVKEHRRARARTNEDREIAILAASKNLEGVLKRPILGREIGDYSWRELPDARRTLVTRMAEHLWLGAHAAEDAILIDKLLCHASVTDLNARVRDVVSAETLARLEIEASREFAPKLDVSKGVAHAEFVKQLEYHAA